jgi:hypothetical protein
MVSVKYIEEECECGRKQGMNPNCSYCNSFSEARTLGEIPIIMKK